MNAVKKAVKGANSNHLTLAAVVVGLSAGYNQIQDLKNNVCDYETKCKPKVLEAVTETSTGLQAAVDGWRAKYHEADKDLAVCQQRLTDLDGE